MGSILLLVQRKDPKVIVDTGRLKSTLSRLGFSKAASHTGKSLAHLWINRLLERELLADPVLSPVVCDKVTGISKGTHRVVDVLGLVLRHHEFAGDRSYQIYIQNMMNVCSVFNLKYNSLFGSSRRLLDTVSVSYHLSVVPK